MSGLPICEREVGGTSGFYGRTGELRGLINGLQRGQSRAIISGPKMGKSSLLSQIKHSQYEKFSNLYRGVKTVPVVVDLEDLGGRTEVLPNAIWASVAAALQDPPVRQGAVGVQLQTPDFRRAGNQAWDMLEQALCDTWKELRGTQAWCHYALLLDGADALAGWDLRQGLNPLFEMLKRDEDWTPVALIAAGGRSFQECLFDSKSPLGRTLQAQVLGALKDEEANQMIRAMVPEANARLVKEITFLTGNHPYFLNVLLDEIIEYDLAHNLRAAADNAAMRLEPLFEGLWQIFDRGRGVNYRGSYAAPEHALMQLLMEMGEHGCTVNQAEREVGLRPLKEFVDLLCSCGVAERVMQDNQYVLLARSTLWNDWYRQRIAR